MGAIGILTDAEKKQLTDYFPVFQNQVKKNLCGCYMKGTVNFVAL